MPLSDLHLSPLEKIRVHTGHPFLPLLLARDRPEGLGRPRPHRVTLQEAPRVRQLGENPAGTGLNCTFSTSVNKSFPFKVFGEARAKASSFSEERMWNPKDPWAVLPLETSPYSTPID